MVVDLAPKIVLLGLVVLAGCATPVGGPGPEVAGEPVVQTRWTSCDEAVPERDLAFGDGLDATAAPPLGAGFDAVAAVVCRRLPQQRPNAAGTDLVATESRADDIAALLAALRLPSEPRTDQPCTMDLPSVDWFALLDAEGRWVRPGVPIDACAKPRFEVRNALRELNLTVVRTRVVRELESDAAASSGCGQGYADMVWVETTQGGSAKPGRPTALWPATTQVRLCVFRVPDSEKGSGKPAGEFERGTPVLSALRWAEISAAVLAAGPARACSTPAGRFAMLRQVDGAGGEIYVELDGCRRILVATYPGKHVLAQADAALIGLLDAA